MTAPFVAKSLSVNAENSCFRDFGGCPKLDIGLTINTTEPVLINALFRLA